MKFIQNIYIIDRNKITYKNYFMVLNFGRHLGFYCQIWFFVSGKLKNYDISMKFTQNIHIIEGYESIFL